MNIQDALKAAQEIFPEQSDVHVSLDCTLYPGQKLRMTRYIFTSALPRNIVSSDRSWEHALAIARSGNEDLWEDAPDEIDEVNA